MGKRGSEHEPMDRWITLPAGASGHVEALASTTGAVNAFLPGDIALWLWKGRFYRMRERTKGVREPVDVKGHARQKFVQAKRTMLCGD